MYLSRSKVRGVLNFRASAEERELIEQALAALLAARRPHNGLDTWRGGRINVRVTGLVRAAVLRVARELVGAKPPTPDYRGDDGLDEWITAAIAARKAPPKDTRTLRLPLPGVDDVSAGSSPRSTASSSSSSRTAKPPATSASRRRTTKAPTSRKRKTAPAAARRAARGSR